MVVFIAARSPLPFVPWHEDAPAFYVEALADYEEVVRNQFSLPYVVSAGSHTFCGCGFNEGRNDPNPSADTKKLSNSLESSAALIRYIKEHRVEQIYSCWSGEEDQPREFTRRIQPDTMLANDFVFIERELLTVEHEVV